LKIGPIELVKLLIVSIISREKLTSGLKTAHSKLRLKYCSNQASLARRRVTSRAHHSSYWKSPNCSLVYSGALGYFLPPLLVP